MKQLIIKITNNQLNHLIELVESEITQARYHGKLYGEIPIKNKFCSEVFIDGSNNIENLKKGT